MQIEGSVKTEESIIVDREKLDWVFALRNISFSL